jgi:hypothetical protein
LRLGPAASLTWVASSTPPRTLGHRGIAYRSPDPGSAPAPIPAPSPSAKRLASGIALCSLRGRAPESWPPVHLGRASFPAWWSGAHWSSRDRTHLEEVEPAAPRHHGGVGRTVNPVTTVLLSAILLVAVMFVVVVAALALAARAYSRRQLDDARAQARHWVERLGGELLVLDSAAVRSGAVGPAGLAEAAERFAAAGAELGAARSRRQCRIAQDTAVEGLHHVRTARRSLGLDPGPRVPGQGVGGAVRAALAEASWSMPRLVDAVLADGRGGARQLPAGMPEPVDWIRQQRRQWTPPDAVRR